MRAWVVGFLLAVMSLQLAWGGIAVYCEHEADVATDHIGHHEHRHQQESSGEADADDARGGIDGDCAWCHLGCAQPLASAVEPWRGAATLQLISAAPMRYRSRSPEGLERPNWQRLARSASREEQRNT